MTSSTPRPSVVVDASVIIALLIDDGPEGHWAIGQCQGHRLIAPAVLHFEVANVLRRQVRAGRIDVQRGLDAHQAAVDLRVDLLPYSAVADRVWALRDNLTSYDAAYCAVAELAQAPLVTLDAKLARASGPECEIRNYGN